MKVATSRYDLNGCTASRLLRQEFLSRIIPVGSFGGGPNLWFLLELWILHTFGRWIVRLLKRRP